MYSTLDPLFTACFRNPDPSNYWLAGITHFSGRFLHAETDFAGIKRGCKVTNLSCTHLTICLRLNIYF